MADRVVDPVTLEVVRNRLDAIAQEMQDALVRSAYSNIIKEGHDCSAALFDRFGEAIAQATALPAQLGVLAPAVQRILELYPADTMRDGDVFILNDPYDGGTHLPDIALIAPVMHAGLVEGMTACIAHHQDVGGKTPGSLPTDATDIFQEGLRIPPLHFHEAGRPGVALHAMIERNVRLPDIVMGDLRAQLAALHVGRARLQDLFAAQGIAQVRLCMAELLDRAELLTRRAIETIPDGSYTFEDYLDDDGIDRAELVRIRASIHVLGGTLHIDFTGSSPQVKGPINVDGSALMSAVYFVVRALADPSAPNNGGVYRVVRLTLPEASIVSPRHPAPVNGRTITMKRVTDALFGALVQAIPDRLPAAPSGMVRVLVFGGTDPATGRRYVCTDFSTGGTGGQPDADGVDAMETDIANTMNMPAESLELNFPVRVHRNALWQDSGGAGMWRGGLGVEREIEILRGEAVVTLREDRHRTRGWGLQGGQPSALAKAAIVSGNGDRRSIPAKGVYTLQAGDRIHCWASGGGGYGDPLRRDAERVRRDVLDGKISRDAAARDYGVVLSDDLGDDLGDVDARKTAEERAARRSSGPVCLFDRGDVEEALR
jgi:N-methylhydantoinase B